ncbi:hypothetical protein BH11ARM2_BH11ARM2_37280 [soil metagenome]
MGRTGFQPVPSGSPKKKSIIGTLDHMARWLPIVVLVYGILLILGGIIGFVTAHSIWSLVSGGTLGIASIGAAAWAKTDPKKGYAVAAVCALLTVGIMIERFISTGKPMPAFGVIFLSLVMLGLLGYAHLHSKKGLTTDVTP